MLSSPLAGRFGFHGVPGALVNDASLGVLGKEGKRGQMLALSLGGVALPLGILECETVKCPIV